MNKAPSPGMPNDLMSVKEDLKSVKEDIKSIKEDLKSTKEDLIKKIDSLEKSLRINIAIRDSNSITRTMNASASRLMPLYSVLTGTPIEHCPTTRHELEILSNPQVIRILAELEDLLYDPSTSTADVTKNRLAMLVGITAASPFVAHNVVKHR
ncbi:hypothetical protein E0Z10_g1849 [Xylaria hypoxylon]|uniref:Uncharacterized protein n=1 Tax=Xylaria hypoxylon TaxID=37992 RepID=A0A4Z0YSI2_9PEZI|nr:hypothetical protein E0Z10_g1849 [Xylaria hypoxylon]